MSKITPIEKSRTIDYGSEERKSCWIKKNVSSISAFPIPSTEFSAKDSVICVMSEGLDGTMAQKLFDLAEYNRIYVLVDSIDIEMEEKLKKRCLIKRDKNITGSFILDVNKKNGLFLNGQMNAMNKICLTLDGEQTEILYRYFCCRFWQTEHDSPVDVFPNYDNFCDSAFIQKMMTGKKKTAFVPAILSEIDSSRIITSLTGNIDNYVRQIAGNGTQILALKNGNSVHVVENDDGMFIIPKTNIAVDAVSWALKLNESQKKQVKDYLRQIEENADYEFFTSKTRAELAGKEILPLGEKDDIRIEHSNEVKLNDNVLDSLLPQNEFETAEPPNFADNGRFVKITYKWRNVPFYLPQGASKHRLYADWENEIKKIFGFLDGILQRIDAAEKKGDKLAKAITRLFLGKKTNFGGMKTKINELKIADFANIAGDELKEKIAKINKISSEVKCDIQEIEEENRKAKIDEEITAIKEEIVKKENQINELEKELKDETTKKTEKLEEKKKLLNQLEAKKKEETGKKEKPEIETSKQEEPEQEKIGKEDIAKEITSLEKEIKMTNNRYQSDVDKIKQEINGLNGKVNQKEREKKAAPPTKPKESDLKVFNKDQKSNHFQSGAPVSELKAPDLPFLPKTGTSLWQLDNKVYLAIVDWDNFDLGKVEAKRLSATLCAERS